MCMHCRSLCSPHRCQGSHSHKGSNSWLSLTRCMFTCDLFKGGQEQHITRGQEQQTNMLQVFEFHDMKWSLWDRWILEGDLTVQEVLDWFKVSSQIGLPCTRSILSLCCYVPGVHASAQMQVRLCLDAGAGSGSIQHLMRAKFAVQQYFPQAQRQASKENVRTSPDCCKDRHS